VCAQLIKIRDMIDVRVSQYDICQRAAHFSQESIYYNARSISWVDNNRRRILSVRDNVAILAFECTHDLEYVQPTDLPGPACMPAAALQPLSIVIDWMPRSDRLRSDVHCSAAINYVAVCNPPDFSEIRNSTT